MLQWISSRPESSKLICLGCVLWIVGQANAQPRGGPNAPDLELVEEFDTNQDGVLDATERKAARTYLEETSSGHRRRGPRRGPPLQPGTRGPKVAIEEAEHFPDSELYDPSVLRTFFFEFENDVWEKELELFKPTDIEVPAKLTVDGKKYTNVGVSFRGSSSFFMVPTGSKRSLNVSMDFIDDDQRLYGYKSLNLLNCNGDPSMMSSLLYSYIASQRIPTPKVNFVKVVINGESWGVYVSSQQFNKTFVKEHFGTKKGARWKVAGSPRGDGGLRYLGEQVQPYRERFEIKSKDKEDSWRDLIQLCRVLNETPADRLEAEITPILDVEGALWFLAVDVAVINSDGYWTRASDFNIYQEPDGKFHILPHDMNEAFRIGHHGGPPRGRGPSLFDRVFSGGRGRGNRGGPRFGPPGMRATLELDPLVGLDNERMPLRSKLLNVPKWRQKYLEYVAQVAQLMEWDRIGPIVEQARELIDDEVAKDTRKLTSYDGFREAVSSAEPKDSATGLRAFTAKRSAYLLEHPEIRDLMQND